jgi:hypothetical protein
MSEMYSPLIILIRIPGIIAALLIQRRMGASDNQINEIEHIRLD